MEISEAQRREIDEMDWLIADVERNGIASRPLRAEGHGTGLEQQPGEHGDTARGEGGTRGGGEPLGQVDVAPR